MNVKIINPDVSKGASSLIATNLSILRSALEGHHSYIGIFEDDVYFIIKRNPTSTLSAAACEIPNDFGLLYLGAHFLDPIVKHRQVSPHLIRLNPEPNPNPSREHAFVCGTQAIIFSKSAIEYILSLSESVHYEAQWDVFLSKYLIPKFPCYMVNPAFAFQIEDFSDIEGKVPHRTPLIRKNERHIIRGEFSRNLVTKLISKVFKKNW
jgi:GR25 family glycosyltransferase involved in LPS biosynthesis